MRGEERIECLNINGKIVTGAFLYGPSQEELATTSNFEASVERQTCSIDSARVRTVGVIELRTDEICRSGISIGSLGGPDSPNCY